jgi:hypothetical protein
MFYARWCIKALFWIPDQLISLLVYPKCFGMPGNELIDPFLIALLNSLENVLSNALFLQIKSYLT